MLIALLPACRLAFDDQTDPDDPNAGGELGDVITLTFDEDTDGIRYDRSGGDRLDGGGVNVTYGGGFYGFGSELNSDIDFVRVADAPELVLGNTLTIEAWIFPRALDRDQTIFGDLDQDAVPAAEMALEVSSSNRLAFVSNAGCSDASKIAFAENAVIEEQVWSHVAVTWDAAEVRFYLNGELTDSSVFAHVPCETEDQRPFLIGNSHGDAHAFRGIIDDVKVSSFAKSAEQIERSMRFNSVTLYPTCGDFIVEQLEECDGADLCCDNATCTLSTDGTSCGDGGTCASGACLVAGGRVTDGLVALYEFNDGAGTVVSDTSGAGLPLDLTISDELLVTWGTDALTIDDDVIISSGVAAAKIRAAAVATGELTIEAWLQPANRTQDGPARIVTMSPDTATRNATLGQEDGTWIGRIRTSSAIEGIPQINSGDGDVITGAPSHLVITRDATGYRRFYVNGVLRGVNRVGGDFSNWDETVELHLANEVGLLRPWLGTLHLVAIYDRALPATEVARNHSAGADP